MKARVADVYLWITAIPRVFDYYADTLWRALLIILAASGVVFWLLIAYEWGANR